MSGTKQERFEDAVLGILLRNPEAITKHEIDERHFQKWTAVIISCKEVSAKGDEIDILSVSQHMKRNDMLLELNEIREQGAGALSNLPKYLEGLRDIWRASQMRMALTSAVAEIDNGGEVDAIVSQLMQSTLKASASESKSYNYGIKQAMGIFLDKLESVLDAKESGGMGLNTGIKDLDAVLGGMHPSDMVIVGARPGVGKCFGKGTMVMMFDGSKKPVEDICEGDLLMGDDSAPRKVLSLARGKENMYWVHQNHGMSYRVNESHILSLKRSQTEGKHKSGDVLNISVKDYLNMPEGTKHRYKGYKTGVNFPSREVLVDPYFLGLWLGDGASSSVRITNPDPEISAYLNQYADYLGQKFKTHKVDGKCDYHTITTGVRGGYCRGAGSLQAQLNSIGVLNNKHVPDDYLYNSREVRLRLLAGIIDTDGHYTGNGYEVTQKNKKLALNIKSLAETLGLRVSFREKVARIKDISYECLVFRLIITGDIWKIPCKVKRKIANETRKNKNWLVTGINVKFDCYDDYYGFEIDGNKLFLLEDTTVTHNTSFGVSVMMELAKKGKRVAMISSEMSVEQVMLRITSLEAYIPGNKLRDADLEDADWTRITAATNRLAEMSIRIYDKPVVTIADVMLQSKAWMIDGGVDFIVVDYLTRIKPVKSSGNQVLDVGDVVTGMKNVARSLNIPVMVLAQLNRGAAERRPLMSDLRDSGIIEQEADQILMLYRNPDDPLAPAEIIVEKNRHGESKVAIPCYFDKPTMRWADMARGDNYE